MPTKWPEKRRLIGNKIERLDGPAKATGKAKYSYDINRPGMLHGKILRCPHAHAKLKSIDTAAAVEVAAAPVPATGTLRRASSESTLYCGAWTAIE